MTGLQSVYVAFMLVTALAALSLAALVWRRQRVIGSRAFAALMAAVGLWSLAYAFEIAASSLPAKVVWAQVQYLGITAVAPAWLLFAAQYAGLRRWITRRNVLLTLAVPALTLILVWTHGAHHLLWRETLLWDGAGFPMLRVEHGVVFWLHLAYSYVLVLAGMFVLATAWSRASRGPGDASRGRSRSWPPRSLAPSARPSGSPRPPRSSRSWAGSCPRA